jgi:hypothetical protein
MARGRNGGSYRRPKDGYVVTFQLQEAETAQQGQFYGLSHYISPIVLGISRFGDQTD